MCCQAAGAWLLCISASALVLRLVVGNEAASYIGCFIDGGPGHRILNGIQKNFNQILTQDICNKYCFDKGFAYAGTQNSYECFCSKMKPPGEKQSSDGECNRTCAGNDKIFCGGDNRTSVYSTGIEDPLVTDVDEISKYIGCFKDSSKGRLMLGHRHDFPDSLTHSLCFKVCRRNGFRYAGMEYGKECFCSNNKPSFKHVAKEDECNKMCDGNNLQLCGGNWRLSIFSIGIPGTPEPDDDNDDGIYIGCYKDQETPRALKGHLENVVDNLTPFKCTGLCYYVMMGFLYSGTQNSKWCFCGDEHPNPNSKVSDNECSKPCSGDSNKMCGGGYRNSIRETGIPDIPAHDKYLGCFNDQNNVVLKDIKVSFEKTNSPRRCMNYCLQLKYKYAGVEYGKECLCGNEEPDSKRLVSGDECNMQCSGDFLETCGAGWKLAAYSTNYTTSVIHATTTTNALTTNKPCDMSETSVNGRQVCAGETIFSEDFSDDLTVGNKWKSIVLVPDAPDYEFAVFQKNPKNCYVSKGKLVIKPTVFEDSYIINGLLELKRCTGKLGTRECGFQAFSYNILPPVASARINTQQSFTFRYGIVEIRAKLPIGDWLVPELWLEPKDRSYGPNYASGRIRMAMCRGNRQLLCDGKYLGSNHVESGIMMGPENDVRSRSISRTVPDNWHDHFHNYTLVWKPDKISFKIDNEVQQEIVPQEGRLCEAIGFTSEECNSWNPNSNIAPFDKEFYISIGLSSGNARDFPDSCINGDKIKPWKNLEVKAMLKFWKDKINWITTWSDDKSALYIDHIRVSAL